MPTYAFPFYPPVRLKFDNFHLFEILRLKPKSGDASQFGSSGTVWGPPACQPLLTGQCFKDRFDRRFDETTMIDTFCAVTFSCFLNGRYSAWRDTVFRRGAPLSF